MPSTRFNTCKPGYRLYLAGMILLSLPFAALGNADSACPIPEFAFEKYRANMAARFPGARVDEVQGKVFWATKKFHDIELETYGCEHFNLRVRARHRGTSPTPENHLKLLLEFASILLYPQEMQRLRRAAETGQYRRTLEGKAVDYLFDMPDYVEFGLAATPNADGVELTLYVIGH